MNAILFPGQGSQIIGMGSEFYNNFQIVKEIFNKADDTLNYKISKIILDGPDEQLNLTQNTQPAILTVSFFLSLVSSSLVCVCFGSYSLHIRLRFSLCFPCLIIQLPNHLRKL